MEFVKGPVFIKLVAVLAIAVFLSGCGASTKPPVADTSGASRTGAEYVDSPFGIFVAFAANEFGYFKDQMGFTDNQYWTWVEDHFENLGAHWTRSNLQLMWHVIEPDYDGKYHWNNDHLTDSMIKRMNSPGNEVYWLGVFDDEGGVFPPPYDFPVMRNPLDYPDEYRAFVRAAVERYDGDGIDDASPDVRVKYWQAGNEMHWTEGDLEQVQDYVRFIRMIREAALEADPEARIVLSAPIGGIDVHPFLAQVINELAAGREFEAIDVHQWGDASKWRMPAVSVYRNMLDSKGLTDVQIWSTENGTWQGQPIGLPFQSEQDQAGSLLKRYIYNIANGLDKLFWNNLMEWHEFEGDPGHFSNSMGLVSDGQGPGEDPAMFNRERLAYYSYKLMVEKLEGSDWDGIETVIDGADNVYAFKFTGNTGEPVWVAWWDYYDDTGNSREVTLNVGEVDSVIVTEAVPEAESGASLDAGDYPRFFNTETRSVEGRKVTITLTESPVFVEAK
ncbi:MAG: hypothetical protein KKE90_11755 [Actinobacteria bacterium]|nr:hypothetical protein [Actinomycetota bacterium]MBU4359918.1 hypothetical protein [Actinomycetota bacterium]MBU4441919.1 hypothetical protein [Actinomycetota bacterium]